MARNGKILEDPLATEIIRQQAVDHARELRRLNDLAFIFLTCATLYEVSRHKTFRHLIQLTHGLDLRPLLNPDYKKKSLRALIT